MQTQSKKEEENKNHILQSPLFPQCKTQFGTKLQEISCRQFPKGPPSPQDFQQKHIEIVL